MLSRNKRRTGGSSKKEESEPSGNAPVTFIAPYKHSSTSPIGVTRAHFLDAYSKVCINLIKIKNHINKSRENGISLPCPSHFVLKMPNSCNPLNVTMK